ncbi:MAG TPA: DUF3467 domain-containing protein [Chloroflexota bacterium]
MSESGPSGNGFSVVAERTVPDYYADSAAFEITVYSVVVEFGQVQKPPPGFKGRIPHRPRVRIAMSPQHAKVMAKLMVKNMKAYEQEVGEIVLPDVLYRELGIEKEW